MVLCECYGVSAYDLVEAKAIKDIMKIKTATALVWAFTGVMCLFIVLSSLGHCSVSKQHNNSLGTVMYTENPLMYQAVTLSSAPDSISNIDGNLNLRVKPLGAYMLYDESILFCGMPLDKLRNLRGDRFVLTYERVSHHTVQGLGCHNIVRADSIVQRSDEEKQ